MIGIRGSATRPTATGTSGRPEARRVAAEQLGRNFTGGPAWTLDEATGQYYLNHFLQQPDLNWWNEEVRAEFDDILRFWFDRGVAGFRIDVAHMIVKDSELRDNPPATTDDHWYVQMQGQRRSTTRAGPRCTTCCGVGAIADSYDPPRILVGETYVLEPELFASFYGHGDELNLAFNFMLAALRFEARSCGASSRSRSGCCPTTAGRSGRAGTTTTTASRRAGPMATTEARTACSCCSRCAARRSSTTATRSP